MLGDDLSEDEDGDEGMEGSDLSDSDPSGLDLGRGDEGGREGGRRGRDDADELESDDDF